MAEKTKPWGLPYPTSIGKMSQAATGIKELAVKLNALFNEKLLTFSAQSSEFELKPGEFAETTATLTAQLPEAATTDNAMIGVYCVAGETTVKTAHGEYLVGDFVAGASTQIRLLQGQHVVLQSNGSGWAIVAGEPKREQKYSGQEEFAVNAAHEASATRPALVMLEAIVASPTIGFNLHVAGEAIFHGTYSGTNDALPLTFYVPAGLKWEFELSSGSLTPPGTVYVHKILL